jgi:hypothetical protein
MINIDTLLNLRLEDHEQVLKLDNLIDIKSYDKQIRLTLNFIGPLIKLAHLLLDD